MTGSWYQEAASVGVPIISTAMSVEADLTLNCDRSFVSDRMDEQRDAFMKLKSINISEISLKILLF